MIADWVKAPPALLTLAPGKSGTLHYGFRSKGLGKTRVNFQVQGLDNSGARAQLAGTQSGLIRVHASDGILSTADTSDAVFRVADIAPEIAILYPEDESAVHGMERVQFDVTALDPEDGVLGDARILWASSLDGKLGAGRAFDVSASALKPGLHEIRATPRIPPATPSPRPPGSRCNGIVRRNWANLIGCRAGASGWNSREVRVPPTSWRPRST